MDDTTASQTGWLAIESIPTGDIPGISDDDQPIVRQLTKTWRDKYPRNAIRTCYYLAHYDYQGVAYSIPKEMEALARPMIGWPNKAVRALADLSVFDGFDAPDDIQNQVDDILADTMLDVKVSQTIVSAYMHGCAFIALSADDDGLPVITPRSADWSAAIWDWKHNRVKAALTINDKDKNGYITEFSAWLPGKVYLCRKTQGRWDAEPIPTGFDRPTVVSLSHDAQLNRPFGSSRITRPLMALTDLAFRSIVRMEATAEFYSAPRIWFLGADRSSISPDTWKSVISVINGIPAGKNGEKPAMQQLTQASMQPHSDMLKTIALMVSSETDIPVNDLGITMDNPASAEAMAEAERKLSRTADRQNKRFGHELKDLLAMCLEAQGVPKEQATGIRPIWSPTKETSDAARADYYQKIASVNPSFADSDVGLTKAGLTWDEIKTQRVWEQQQRAQQQIDQLRTQRTTTTEANGGTEQPEPAGRPAQSTGTTAEQGVQELH